MINEKLPERVWLTVFSDDKEPHFTMLEWQSPVVRNTQPGDYVATRPHHKVEYVPADLLATVRAEEQKNFVNNIAAVLDANEVEAFTALIMKAKASPDLNSETRSALKSEAEIRAEEREAALEEAIKWAQKVQAVKLDAARDAEPSNEFAAMRLSHEANGAERVIDTLKAAIVNPVIIRKEGRGMVKELTSRVTLTAREAADLEETLTNVADDLESHGLGDSENCSAARRWARWIEEG